MSRATQRQSLLSANLANVNTPGYKRRDIGFDIALEKALDVSQAIPSATGTLSVRTAATVGATEMSKFDKMREDRALKNGEPGSLRLDGNNVDLEKEVMAIAETELRYQALSDMAARYFSGLKNVIREGR